jgi:hypothetical protein
LADHEYLTVPHLNRRELARVFSKIEINATTGCWEWTASTRGGYGQVRFFGQNQCSHRLLYAWLVEPIPIGQNVMVLDHVHCNLPKCCNPSHIALVTQRDNVIRADSAPGRNTRKTVCNYGHQLPTEPNRPNGHRRCKTCWYRNFRASEKSVANKRDYLRRYNKERMNGPERPRLLEQQRIRNQRRSDKLAAAKRHD